MSFTVRFQFKSASQTKELYRDPESCYISLSVLLAFNVHDER